MSFRPETASNKIQIEREKLEQFRLTSTDVSRYSISPILLSSTQSHVLKNPIEYLNYDS